MMVRRTTRCQFWVATPLLLCQSCPFDRSKAKSGWRTRRSIPTK